MGKVICLMNSCSENYMEKLALTSELYHYTGKKGLYGILGSQTIWATDHQFLNDFSETRAYEPLLVKYHVESVKKIAKKYKKNAPRLPGSFIRDDNAFTMEAENGVKIIRDALVKHADIYVVSFCSAAADSYEAANGLLSQWKGYGGDGGYMIVFDAKRLNALVSQEQNKFAPYLRFLYKPIGKNYSSAVKKEKQNSNLPLAALKP